MASILIVKKQTVPGKKNLPVRTRYHVRWERGRGRPVVHLGVYDTETRAKRRRQTALDQLARGEIPSNSPTPTSVQEPVRVVAERWLGKRLNIAESTRANYQNAIRHINERFGDDDPHAIGIDDVQDWIREQADAGIKTATIRVWLSVLRGILKHAKVRPNPAADEEIELPRVSGQRANRLPSRSELARFYASLETIADGKYVGVVKLMEHGGLRVHEAVRVRYEDWDRSKHRLLIPDSKTYAGERFVAQINGLPEIPGAGSGRVWPNITIAGTKHGVSRACELAKVRLFSSHDLRRLHISRCLRDGMDPSLLAVRAGHSSPQITLSKYSKLVPPE